MTLTEQLKDIVDDYLCRYPNVSINGLAMKSGVGATTLRRIINLSIKGDPAPHTVLNLASAVSNEKQLTKIVQKFDGPIGELLLTTFGPYLKAEMTHVVTGDLNCELGDWIKYAIYKLAANRMGVSRIQVAELFGKIGIDRFDELADRGFLKIENDFAHARDKNFSLDVSVAAKHLPEMVKFYKPQEASEGRNIFYTLSESLNAEAIKKIKEIQKEAIIKIYEVMSATKYAGDIPYMSINLADTIESPTMRGNIQ